MNINAFFRFTLGLALAFTALPAQAQVNAPELICVANDTLSWQAPVNNCGPFNAYLVFGSQNEAGPYSLIGTVTDPAQEFFFHNNAGAGTWYYYLQTDADCPGEPALSSDTLDNLIPLQSPILSASVSGTAVVLSWEASASPEVVGYIVSRQEPGMGTIVLDTVFGNTTYTDNTADPLNRQETYFIEAIDACGNKSLVSPPHTTMTLAADGAVDPCQRSVALTWTPYEGWPVGSYDIFEVAPDGTRLLASTVAGSETAAAFNGVNTSGTYCFAIVANQANGSNTASSPELCVEAVVTEGLTTFAATNATVSPNGIEVTWAWNPDAALAAYNVQRAFNGSGFTDVDAQATAPPLMPNNTYTDAAAAPSTGSYTYQIVATDVCGAPTTSNQVSTIFLAVDAQNGQNTITWTPYTNGLGVVQDYRIFRQLPDGTTTDIGSFGPNTFGATDVINLNDPGQVQACYFAQATATVDLNDTLSVEVVSRSNLACAVQEAKVYIPTAFSPNGDGRNDTFQPFLQFGVPTAYQLTIYNRWGGQVFETQEPGKGWDGTSDGELANTGSYGYTLRIVQASGTVIEESGEVVLVR
ncbi:T9SS type B sorting domain-containing protein [Phaeodactylibacter luteus]|uniref:Gliding motility-associated C-terminal domain-containing protein n=1 Tax=Phaeodactylibacter luteus TaxID=1564516 RepID=A0A5C6RJ95_9BACT|nr:gliding motility-associated C-terminal domain-containing protein [Phaeodactylibacter luteus]TXB62005.1 gliding motility-associated C-terminal domain-containing protein [Phaeodactylibacter luteus]